MTLVWAGPYPISMIGVDDAVLNNSYPTRVTLAFLGMFQAGAVLLAERRLAVLLERPKLWAFAVVVNLRIMSIYLWHLTAMVLVIGMSLLAGGLGLRAVPLSGYWWATRPVWFGVLAAVTVGLVLLFGRFEKPISDRRPAPSLWRPAVATAALCGGLGVMAASGIVSGEGVHWVWPLLPVVALLGLGSCPSPVGGPVPVGSPRSPPDRQTRADWTTPQWLIWGMAEARSREDRGAGLNRDRVCGGPARSRGLRRNAAFTFPEAHLRSLVFLPWSSPPWGSWSADSRCRRHRRRHDRATRSTAPTACSRSVRR